MHNIKRIQKQFADLQKNKQQYILNIGLQNNDLCNWRAKFYGPSQSPYQGGVFELNILFTKQYPFKAPKINFLTKIFHPNISQKGQICLDILGNQFSPSLTARTCILSIISLLTDVYAQEALQSCQKFQQNRNKKDKNDFMNPEIALVYLNDRSQFQKIARQWTQKYAK